jgi:hypothetical protein
MVQSQSGEPRNDSNSNSNSSNNKENRRRKKKQEETRRKHVKGNIRQEKEHKIREKTPQQSGSEEMCFSRTSPRMAEVWGG